MDLLEIFLVFCVVLSSLEAGKGQKSLNVMDFGAVGDGKTDDSQAFLKAWEALCGSTGASATLQIPSGKPFFLQPLLFQGPCNSPTTTVQISGTLLAPSTIDAWAPCQKFGTWLAFSDVSGLIIQGPGKIDGQGSAWWQNSGVQVGKRKRPTALHFNNCSNLHVSGTAHLNSPKGHISVHSCDGVTISNISVTAPRDSPNTDGIDVGKSTNVIISNSVIATGDDCVAINGGCSNINITGVACGPGHGISVGSLGKSGAHDTVERVHVRNCSFSGTQNGARIKTWPGGSGFARNITFEQITLIDSENPIIINQDYCVHGSCTETAKAVAVSDVRFSGFIGTSATEKAITLNCATIGCYNIILEQINITSSPKLGQLQLQAFCRNAHGHSTSTTPPASCLLDTYARAHIHTNF